MQGTEVGLDLGLSVSLPHGSFRQEFGRPLGLIESDVIGRGYSEKIICLRAKLGIDQYFKVAKCN